MNKYKSFHRSGKRIDEHRLIMTELLGRELSFNEVVHHKDGNKSNNSIDNLVLMSRSEHSHEHMKDYVPTDKIKKAISNSLKSYWKNHDSVNEKGVVQLTLDGREIRRFRSARNAQRLTGHSNSHIIQCCSGKRRTHHGFKWKYL